MHDDYQGSVDFGYANMSFSERVSAAFELAKFHFWSIFITQIVVGLVMFILAFIGSMIFGSLFYMMINAGLTGVHMPVGATLGILGLYIVLGLVSSYFSLGIFSLVLKYVDDLQPEGGVINQVLLPWYNFLPLLVCFLVWGGLVFGFFVALGLVALIPYLGILIYLIGLVIYWMILISLFMFLADNMRAGVGAAISTPVLLVKDNPTSFLSALLVAFVSYLPGIILVGLCIKLIENSTGSALLFLFISLVYFLAASVYVLIYFGITYRQTYGGNFSSVVEQVF